MQRNTTETAKLNSIQDSRAHVVADAALNSFQRKIAYMDAMNGVDWLNTYLLLKLIHHTYATAKPIFDAPKQKP